MKGLFSKTKQLKEKSSYSWVCSIFERLLRISENFVSSRLRCFPENVAAATPPDKKIILKIAKIISAFISLVLTKIIEHWWCEIKIHFHSNHFRTFRFFTNWSFYCFFLRYDRFFLNFESSKLFWLDFSDRRRSDASPAKTFAFNGTDRQKDDEHRCRRRQQRRRRTTKTRRRRWRRRTEKPFWFRFLAGFWSLRFFLRSPSQRGSIASKILY